MKKNSVLLIFASLLSAFIVQAQDGQITKLSFNEAVKIGLDNNLNLNQQKNNLELSQAQRISAYSNMGPRINASAQAWRTLGNQFIEQEARVVNDARTNNFFGTINGSIVLFNGLNRVSAVQESGARLDAQQYFIKRSEQDVISNISSQFLQCLLDQEALTIEEQNLELQKRQLNQIKEQVALGARAPVDEYNQEFQVKDAELKVLRAKNTLRNDKATLSNTLLLDPVENFELANPEWDLAKLDMAEYTLEEMYQQAEARRADLQRAKELESASKFNVRSNFTAVLPTLSAFAGYNSRYSNASTPTFENQLMDNKRTQYGLQLDIPIFTNWQNRTSYVQSKVTYNNAKLTTEGTKITVKNDVLRAYQNYQDAILAYQASAAQLKAAEVNFGFQKERYDLAITDLIQFTQASRDYVQAQTTFAQSKYRLMFQKILMDYALGTLSFESIP